MRVFLINLEKNKERLAYMQAQLERLGVAFERIPAVYGKELSRKELCRKFSAFRSYCATGVRLTLGEVGCALSHIKIYRRMIEENLSYALIFEDDIIIDSSLNVKLQEIERFINPQKAQVVLLSALGFDGGNTPGILKNDKAMCTDGYVITLPAAKKICYTNHPVVLTADSWRRWEKRFGVEIYCCWPPVVLQDNATFGTDVNTVNRKVTLGIWKWFRKARRVPEVFIDWLWFKVRGK